MDGRKKGLPKRGREARGRKKLEGEVLGRLKESDETILQGALMGRRRGKSWGPTETRAEKKRGACPRERKEER